jgi:hypothetical protein
MRLELMCLALILLALAANASERSVSVTGHNFSFDLDDNWKPSTDSPISYDPENMVDLGITDPDAPLSSGASDWTGTEYVAFDYMSDKIPSGMVSLLIIKPTKESLEKNRDIVDDSWLLEHATDLRLDPRNHYKEMASCEMKVIDIDFNGRPAHLVELERQGGDSYGVIAFSLGDDNIAVFDVDTHNLDMRPLDIIETITVK